MKRAPNPTRLVESSEFGSVVRRLSARNLNPSRLAEAGKVIEARVAELAAGGVAATTAAAAIKGAASVKVILPVALAVTGGAAVMVWQGGDQPAVEAPMVARPVEKGVEQTQQQPPQPADPPRRRLHPKPTHSPLEAQLALFDRASAAAEAGDFSTSLRLLDRLDRAHSGHPLYVEVVSARADVLSRSGDDRETIRYLERVESDPKMADKRAQLLRLLGDSLLRVDDCPRAVSVYQRALGLGLEQGDLKAAQAGLARCAAR